MFDNAIGCMEFCCAAFAVLAACRVGLRITLIGLQMIKHLRPATPTTPSASWADQRRAA
jgi:hypothetical protein